MDSTSNASVLSITEVEIQQVVERYILEKQGKCPSKLRILSHHAKRLSAEGEPVGYLGDHYFLNIVLRKESTEEQTISFFVKILPEHVPKLADYVQEMGCFQKEIRLYTGLLPRLQDVMTGTMPFAPRAYYSRGEKLLISENLQAKGYKMVQSNRILLDYQHLKVALEAVAKLHAASLVLENQTKQCVTKQYPGVLDENAYVDDGNYVRKINLDNAIDAMCELIKRIGKYQKSDKLGFILEKFPRVIRKIYLFAKPSSVYRNVVNHGDLWSNNIMFLYDTVKSSAVNSGEGSPQPTSAILLDYQLSRYAPPALDVLTLIMLGCMGEFRTRHLHSLLDAYYTALSANVTAHNLNMERILSRKEFETSCEYYHLAGLIENVLFSHLILIPAELVKPLMGSSESFDDFIRNGTAKVQLCVKSFEQDETFRVRLTDGLSAIIDRYIL
ncbi:uncharacterized protein LOC128740854 [Sabethes cyaneus]|uniref:uncharacterized protein LOC128740854 n=1 Tax=Sabethes cyaneus TaxID=53552 RepID=UPI00237EB97A|nr:uncharacterized protein LOC128740854 [Sabethes cyaneus]